MGTLYLNLPGLAWCLHGVVAGQVWPVGRGGLASLARRFCTKPQSVASQTPTPRASHIDRKQTEKFQPTAVNFCLLQTALSQFSTLCQAGSASLCSHRVIY